MDSRVYPDTTLMGTASIWPLAMVNSVHLYHMLGFPGQLLPWAAVEPAGAFFISGLPGGISYLLLGNPNPNPSPSPNPSPEASPTYSSVTRTLTLTLALTRT